MSKLLAIFGATGQQGSSVINYVLNDAELSQKYKIRAITRDVNSDKAKQLKQKVEVVQGDMLDRTTLESALIGVHTIFAMTTPSYGPDALEIEYNCGKTIADVAVKKGVEYIIFSTLPSTREMSREKYTKITPFDAKAKVERYIRDLPIKSAFCSLGFFMENFHQGISPLRQTSDGVSVLARPNSPETQMPYIDAVGDTGKFVGAILAKPDQYQGKTFCAAQALYSWEEIPAVISKTTGKNVIYKQVSPEEFRKSLPFESDDISDIFVEGFSCGEEFGYFGPDTKGLVAWAAENARGRLSTLEEYFQTHPLRLP